MRVGRRGRLGLAGAVVVTVGIGATVVAAGKAWTAKPAPPTEALGLAVATPVVAPTAKVEATPMVVDEAPVVAMAVVEPESETPDKEEPTVASLDPAGEARLAREIARLKARDSHQLVSVVRSAFDEQRPDVPLTFLLSIAFNETHGKILAVSPSGAVGLAQATPAAYLAEPGYDGKLFITNDYLVGARSYIMKKPLGDAAAIASSLLWKNDPGARARARGLLDAAFELQREGMDELHVLEPHAPPLFAERIQEADEYNTAALVELGRLIEGRPTKAQLTHYRDRVRKRFVAMMDDQQHAWTAYQEELEGERDRLLRARYGTDPATVIRTRAYDAGEYLGEALDVRFSPTHMAHFLAAHLTTKQRQARDLGIADHELEAWTAALYNGGAVNVKRMRAGLLGTLKETQSYMRKIPALREDLDRVLGVAPRRS